MKGTGMFSDDAMSSSICDSAGAGEGEDGGSGGAASLLRLEGGRPGWEEGPGSFGCAIEMLPEALKGPAGSDMLGVAW